MQLLGVDALQEQRRLDKHKFTTGLLLVNKQINAEASEILYLRNTWIRITMTREGFQELNWRVNRAKSESRIELRDVHFAHEAALEMVISTYGVESKGEERTCIVSSFGLPQVCRALTDRSPYAYKMAVLELDMNLPREGVRWDQKGLLECFVETQGLASLKISSRLAKFAGDMGQRLIERCEAPCKSQQSFNERLERVSTYETRGLQMVLLRRLYQAHIIFQEGLCYIEWLSRSPIIPTLCPLSSDQRFKLAKQRWDIGKASIHCCMELGDKNFARGVVRSLFKNNERAYALLDLIAHAEGYYYLGLMHVADGADNHAAYSFLKALQCMPGYADADKAVDEMRERLNNSTDFQHAIVRHNIDNILQPFRHQAPGQDRLEIDEANVIIDGFIGSIRDLDGVEIKARKVSWPLSRQISKSNKHQERTIRPQFLIYPANTL